MSERQRVTGAEIIEWTRAQNVRSAMEADSIDSSSIDDLMQPIVLHRIELVQNALGQVLHERVRSASSQSAKKLIDINNFDSVFRDEVAARDLYTQATREAPTIKSGSYTANIAT